MPIRSHQAKVLDGGLNNAGEILKKAEGNCRDKSVVCQIAEKIFILMLDRLRRITLRP